MALKHCPYPSSYGQFRVEDKFLSVVSLVFDGRPPVIEGELIDRLDSFVYFDISGQPVAYQMIGKFHLIFDHFCNKYTIKYVRMKL